MRGMRPGLGIALAALTLGACGTASADLSDTTASGPGSAATAVADPRGGPGQQPRVASPRDARGPVFPLTLRRTGGIAGYADSVTLEATGRVLVETRSVHDRVCVLPEQERVRLFSLLATLRDAGPEEPAGSPTPVEPLEPLDPSDSTEPGESDVIRISLTDSRNQSFDLSDPSLGSVSDLVGALVSDVTLTSPSTVTCKTSAS